MSKNTKKIILSMVLLAVSGIMMLLFSQFPSFFFPAYQRLSQKWISMLAAVFSFQKIAIWDIGLFCLFVFLLIYTVLIIIRKKKFADWFSTVLLSVTILVFLAVNGWMLNHYGPKLDQQLELNIKQLYTIDELEEACEYYLTKAGEYADRIARDSQGHALTMDFYELAEMAGESYRKLGQTNDAFKGSYKPVKKLSIVGEYLMYNGIVGMFMPITGEAGVPESVPPVPLAYTMAHEAAHRLGIASEQDANFAAFLACMSSDDDRFLYSGYYQAFSYLFSSLYRADSDKAAELITKYENDKGILLVRLDRKDTSEYYARYESPLREISDNINDTYLKTFSEEDGILSYGKVSENLIAYYQTYIHFQGNLLNN